jgi:PAS domain S-box-containing protein
MLCIASSDGYFKRISPAFTRTLGWSVEELTGKPFIEFVHPEDRAATLPRSIARCARGRRCSISKTATGTRTAASARCRGNRPPQPDGTMYATARDITERRESEHRIIELNRQLLHRQSALEQANKELESFSYSVSHDLRAPLRHIDGYARMLSEDVGASLGEEPRRYLGTSSTARAGWGC